MHLEFTPLNMDRQKEYHACLNGCPQLMTSDFSFANVYGWAEHYGLEWTFHKGLCFIRQTKPETIYWAPIGPWDKYDWKKCCVLHEKYKFTRIPEALTRLWSIVYGNNITIEENREHWDYIYSVEELIALKGKKFHKKKNLLNQFKKTISTNMNPCLPNAWKKYWKCRTNGTNGMRKTTPPKL